MAKETKKQKELRLASEQEAAEQNQSNGVEQIEEAEVVQEITALAEIRQEYGLKLANEKVEGHLLTYTPFFKELLDLQTELEELLVKPITKETEKEATELRKRYAAIRISAGKQKAEDKAEINLEGGFLDKVNKRIEDAAKLNEAKCKEIETKLQDLAAKAKEELVTERRQALEALGYDTEFLSLGDMVEESFNRLLGKARETYEALKEKSEREQVEQADKDRLRARKEARIKDLSSIGLFFNADMDGYEGSAGFVGLGSVEQMDDNEFIKAYNKVKQAYDNAKQAEEDRLAAEKEKAERITNRINAVTKLGLTYDTVKEQYDGYGQSVTLVQVQTLSPEDFTDVFDLAKSNVLAAKKKAADDQKARDDKAEAERKENERLRKEKADKEKAEQDAKDKAERERKAAATAPDVDKLRALYKVLHTLPMPEMVTAEGKAALAIVMQGLAIVKTVIVDEAKKLS